MKKFIILFILSLYGMAGEFASLHQVNTPQGLINKFKQNIDSNGHPKVKEFYDGTSFIVTDEARPKEDSWCGDVMPSYKIYIPVGLENVTIGAVAKPNSSYYIWYAFVPDGENYTEQTLPFRFVKMIDAKVIYQEWNTKESGWLYLRIIQASNFVYSQFGHVDSPRVYLSVKYRFKDDMTDFNNWLKITRFTSNGDPIDMFSKAYETSRYCSSYKARIAVYGSTSGVFGSSLVPWLQTDDPSLTIESDKTTIPTTSSNITYTIDYKVGEKPISAISIDINNNVTDGVLLQDKIDECMKFVEASKESGKDGVFVYSDNGENWYLNRYDTAIVDNIRYIGYLIEDGNPRDGDSEQVLLARESGKIKIVANIAQDCLSKSSLVNVATMKYRRDGAEKSIQNTVTITANTSSGSTPSGGSGSGGGGSTSGSGGNSGNTGEDESSYYGGGSQQSSYNSSNIESDAKTECERDGGRWVDGACLRNPSSRHSSSVSSSFSSSSIVSQAQRECERDGGRWVDGACLRASASHSASSHSSSASSDSTIEHIIEVVETISEKKLPVKGYFARYGEGAFDWIYKSANGGLYKLEGMQRNGYLIWKPLGNYFPHAYVKNNQLILGEPKLSRDESVRDLELIRTIKSKSAYKVNGYFTQYANGAFDWVYVIDGSNKIYKLDGMVSDGRFKWTPLSQYLEEVKVEGYKDITIGKPSPLIRCLALGGEWDDKNELCIVSRNSYGYQSSSNNPSFGSDTASQAQQECERDGGRWVDGACLQSPSHSSSVSSTSSSSSSANRGDEFPSG